MDSVFLLSEDERQNYIHLLMQHFRCTYICLWSYQPHPSNCLIFWGGLYQEEMFNQEASSSSGTLARRCFLEYQQSQISALDDRIPGLAFKTNRPYLQLNGLDLQNLASVNSQQQFYKEARISTAVYMGCRSGEIEMGWAILTHVNLESDIRAWFPDDFLRQSPIVGELSQAVDPIRQSSSSSSLRSLSFDSQDSSSLVFNKTSTGSLPQSLHVDPVTTSSLIQQSIQSLNPTLTTPLQQAIQSLTNFPSKTQFATIGSMATIESVDAAITSAILAVLSSSTPSSSSTSSFLSPQFEKQRQRGSAFKDYASSLAPTATAMKSSSLLKQSMIKRAISYYRGLNTTRREPMFATRSTPTSTQMLHMMSERKRREKINESFQALRSLLPPESKKDKASVLSRTREYLTSLKEQVEELTRRNQKLEAELLSRSNKEVESKIPINEDRPFEVQIRHLSESTSNQRVVELRVNVRGEGSVSDMTVRLLEFMRQDNNVNLLSVEANTTSNESTSFNRLVFRLAIEGSDWDESSFQEAVKRIAADFAL